MQSGYMPKPASAADDPGGRLARCGRGLHKDGTKRLVPNLAPGSLAGNLPAVKSYDSGSVVVQLSGKDLQQQRLDYCTFVAMFYEEIVRVPQSWQAKRCPSIALAPGGHLVCNAKTQGSLPHMPCSGTNRTVNSMH